MTYYRHAAVDKIERAIAAAIASRSLDHALFKGRLREILITELVRPFLLPQLGAITGLIVDQDGRQSNQIDVIIYDERVVPPLMLSPSEGIVPCHSVLATIEVKSRLNMTELKKAVQNARSVKVLKYDYENVPLPGERGFELVFQRKLLDLLQIDPNLKEQLRHSLFDISSPACYLFAFTSDLAPSRLLRTSKYVCGRPSTTPTWATRRFWSQSRDSALVTKASPIAAPLTRRDDSFSSPMRFQTCRHSRAQEAGDTGEAIM